MVYLALCYDFVLNAMSEDQKPYMKTILFLFSILKTVLDSYTEAESILISGKKKTLLIDVLNAINKAKTDDNIKGISIEADEFTSRNYSS
jgi:protease-4